MWLYFVVTMLQHFFSLYNHHPFWYSSNVPKSFPVTLHHSNLNKTTMNLRKYQKSVSQSETWKASSTCSPLWHLACATNSYFFAKSTEAGYLFLLTTPAPNIKSHKFLSIFPAQTTTNVIKPSPWRINLWIKGKQMSTNKHLNLSFSFCFFLTPVCLTAQLDSFSIFQNAWIQKHFHWNVLM